MSCDGRSIRVGRRAFMTGALAALGDVCLSAPGAPTPCPVFQVSPVDARYLADAAGQTFVPVGCNICFLTA